MLQSKKKGIVFHGFLGDAKDFKFLDSYYDMTGLNLKPQKMDDGFETWDQMCQRVLKTACDSVLEYSQSFENHFKDSKSQQDFSAQFVITLFSYSMGNKVLFTILDPLLKFVESKSLKVNMVFMSSHFGLYETNEEFEKDLAFRVKMNERFLSVLEVANLNEFEKEWNNLALFNKDNITRFDKNETAEDLKTTWSLEQVRWYFKEWNRSQKIFEKNRMGQFKSFNSISAFYGSEDFKYKNQALRFYHLMQAQSVNSIQVIELKDRSHRLLQNEDFEIILKHL